MKILVACWACWYARQRKDICGIYCTGGFKNHDGTCEHFVDYAGRKKEREKERKARCNEKRI